MNSFFTIIKSDYLQRSRSYAFLVTLCASLAIAYTFVPEPNANYSTIRIADYVGYYNAAWFGYVTAIMSSIFLSLIGFYLVNSSIKTDIETKVGQIVSTTKVSNFWYLFSKVLSNFLVLLTILSIIFVMSIALFFLYNEGFPFEIISFLKPYLTIAVPALFFIASLAVVLEVFFGKYSVIQNVGFFFLFSFLIFFAEKKQEDFSFDVFGTKIVMQQMEEQVRIITNTNKVKELSIGYVLGNVKKAKKFQFHGVDFPNSFIFSRFIWILLSIGILIPASLFFHRFNIQERKSVKGDKIVVHKQKLLKELSLSKLSEIQTNYAILPLMKTELKLLIRKGKKWLWLINGIGMVLLTVLPIQTAHQFVLPILWFLQVHRLSEITTKERTNNVHYFAFSSYKPVTRLLYSQLITCIILLLFLASPILIRLLISGAVSEFIPIVLGAIFLVFLAAFLGILTKGKKFF